MDLTMFGIGMPSLIGLDIGSSTVKAIELNLKGKDKGFELKGLGIASLPPEAIVQGAFLNSGEIVDTIREAIDTGGFKTKDVAVAVSGHSVIVKKVSLPSMNREELEDQIQWELGRETGRSLPLHALEPCASPGETDTDQQKS